MKTSIAALPRKEEGELRRVRHRQLREGSPSGRNPVPALGGLRQRGHAEKKGEQKITLGSLLAITLPTGVSGRILIFSVKDVWS